MDALVNFVWLTFPNETSDFHNEGLMSYRLVTCIALLSLALPALAFAQSRAWLDKGNISVKVFKVPKSETPKAVVKAVIDAPPAKVWKLVSDCSRYTKTMNRVKSSKLISQSGDTVICETVIDMPFPFSNLKGRTKAKHVVTPKRMSRSWSLIKGDYHFNNGSWVVEPFDEQGTRSLVTYSIHAEPTTTIPDWVRNKAQKKTLPGIIKRLRKEAKK